VQVASPRSASFQLLDCVMYISKRKPREKQAEALEKLDGRKAFAVLMAMRTGKTKVIADDFGRLVHEGKVRDLLVIAPAGAYIPWASAVCADLPDEIADYLATLVWVSKKRPLKSFRTEIAQFLAHRGPRMLLVNIEAISSVQEARSMCKAFLKEFPGKNMVVVDESVVIKNPTSTCSKFCVDTLAEMAEYKRILSGLVAPRSPLDVYQQFRFLDKNIFPETFDRFRDKYANVKRVCQLPMPVVRNKYFNTLKLNRPMSEDQLRQVAKMIWPDTNELPNFGFLRNMVMDSPHTLKKDEMVSAIFRAGGYIPSIPIIQGYKNLEELHDRIAPYSFRVRLEDCFDLPEADYSFFDVEMHPEQERVYAELREFMTAQLRDAKQVTAQNVISLMLRLHQVVCGHTKDESGNIVFLPEKRIAAVLDILETYDGKAIIWCSYDVDVKKLQAAIEDAYGEGSVARFWGGNRPTREDEEKQFKEDPNCRFMIATPDAGGRGRTWDNADLVIYHSSRNNLDHRMQSEERVKAVGKTRQVSYIDLRAKGTVEEKIIEALRNKIDIASVISGDDWMSWLI